MSDRMGGIFVAFMLTMMLALMAITFMAGREVHSLKIEAVKRGLAEWKVDEIGNTSFQWKD